MWALWKWEMLEGGVGRRCQTRATCGQRTGWAAYRCHNCCTKVLAGCEPGTAMAGRSPRALLCISLIAVVSLSIILHSFAG